MRVVFPAAIFTAAAMLGPATSALAHDYDIGLAVVDGRIVTGAVEEGASIKDVLSNPARLWEAEFDLDGVAAEPGFYGPPDLFAPGTLFGYNVIGPLQRWTGGGFADATERMVLTFPGQSNVIVPGPGADPGSIVIGHTFAAEADGGFDDHPFFNLLQGDFTPGAADGAYLLKLEFRSEGLITSEPIWILFNNGLDHEDFDVAFDYVRDNIVPAPGAIALLGLSGLAALRRRR